MQTSGRHPFSTQWNAVCDWNRGTVSRDAAAMSLLPNMLSPVPALDAYWLIEAGGNEIGKRPQLGRASRFSEMCFLAGRFALAKKGT